ncbi:Unknown protein sequence [Pseudomonas syringae pv. syringae]|nr:Unknown protein sequence [Pseudomonas syringae pv. syringae]
MIAVSPFVTGQDRQCRRVLFLMCRGHGSLTPGGRLRLQPCILRT